MPHNIWKLRAELKAIQEWDAQTFPVRTLIERSAFPIRKARAIELLRKIQAIAARN